MCINYNEYLLNGLIRQNLRRAGLYVLCITRPYTRERKYCLHTIQIIGNGGEWHGNEDVSLTKHNTAEQESRKAARPTTTSHSTSAANHDDTNTHENELATAPELESVETQTAHIGTRVVQPSITKHRDIRRRGRSKGSTQRTPQQATTNPTRARKQSQYKWSSVGRDAFDVL